MKTSFKALDEGVFRHADILNEVFELHRKSNHFSLRKMKPELFDSLARKLEHISGPILREAYGIYLNAPALPKRPHPNYFVAIAIRIHQAEVDKNKKSSYIEGENKQHSPPTFGKSI
jgi:hypothetical protein